MWAGREASDRIVGYYSYLFTFPSHRIMIAAISALSTMGCTLAFTLAWGPASAVRGLLYGLLGLTAPLLASDLFATALFRDDVFLTQRRLTILSYASCFVYVAMALLSSLALVFTGGDGLIARGILFAVAVNAFLRHITISVFSTRGLKRNLATAFMQPALCLAAGIVLLPVPSVRIPVLGMIGIAIVIGGGQLMLWVMGRWEGAHSGLRIMPLFRAFVLAWAEEVNGPLEDQIARVGEERDLSVDSLIYRDVTGGCRAAMIVPYIHPGPFRNVGSSAMPEVLSRRFGKELGCEVLVPHGVSTHERDLAHSGESERVTEAITSSLASGRSSDLASPVVRVEREGAQASCQLFGDAGLITLTLSPKSCDDLPEELSNRIMEAASEMGVTAVVVDSHNSLLQEDLLNDSDVDNLYRAAVEAISRAREAPRRAFSVGAARVVPKEWGLDDGMGPCGIAALAVRFEGGQTFAYVVLDGNNMRSGLREPIVDALKARGIGDAEVLTSDTHVVNAIGATSRGYYTIGERTEEERLIEYVVEAVETAISRLGRCSCSHSRTVVEGLTVLGTEGLRFLGDVLESAFDLFRRTALAVVPASLLLAATAVFLL